MPILLFCCINPQYRQMANQRHQLGTYAGSLVIHAQLFRTSNKILKTAVWAPFFPVTDCFQQNRSY